MIDKYEEEQNLVGCLADMKRYDLAILAEDLLAEVKQLRENYERLHDATAEILNKHFGSSFVKAFWEAIE